MEDDWLNETIIGGDLSWEEQENGTWSQIVVLHLKNGRDITQIIKADVTKKELFQYRLTGEDQWPPIETTLTMMAS